MTTPPWPAITYANLHRAKRNRTLVLWLSEMSSAERVEAAQICAANSRPSVTEWLRMFGDLMDREAARQMVEEVA